MRSCIPALCGALAFVASASTLYASETAVASGPSGGSGGLALSTQQVSSAPPALSDLLEELLAQNPSVLARKASVRASRLSQSAAWNQRLPSLSVTGQSRSRQGDEPRGEVRVQQPLYAGGRIDALNRQAVAQADAAAQALELVRRELSLRLVQAVTELHRFERRRLAAETDVAEHRRLAGIMERRVQAGQSPSMEADLVRARLATSESNILQLHTQVAKLKEKLQQLMGRPVGQLPSVTLPSALALEQSSDALLAIVRETSPELGRLRADRDEALAEVDRIRAELLPGLNLRWSRQRQSAASSLGLDAAYENQTVVEMTLTPAPGLASAYRVAAAKQTADATQDLIRAAERDLVDRLYSQLEDFKGLGPRIALARQAMASSAEVAQSYARLFAVGRRSWLDTLNAQRELTDLAYQLADLEMTEVQLGIQLAIEIGRWDLVCPRGCLPN